MKDYFESKIHGHIFQFSRVTYSSFDIWYHVVTEVNENRVAYRMNRGKQDKWKITTSRMQSVIMGFENDCIEAIQMNEKILCRLLLSDDMQVSSDNINIASQSVCRPC